MCDEASRLTFYGVPAQQVMRFVLAADGTPISLNIDGRYFSIKPSRHPKGPRVKFDQGEHFFTVAEGGHIAAVRTAHIGLRRRARQLGITVEGLDSDAMSYGQRATEIARLAALIADHENAAFCAPAAVNVGEMISPTSPSGPAEIMPAAD